jgi:Na+(H+)/acetate symporter ActP
MVIVAFYAVMGGMKGITYTQIAQYVIMIIAYTIPAVFISFMLTGNPCRFTRCFYRRDGKKSHNDMRKTCCANHQG